MSDPDDILRRAVEGYEPDSEHGLRSTRQRWRRRQLVGRVGTGAAVLGLSGIAMLGLWTTFKGGEDRPVAGPTPGPSGSPTGKPTKTMEPPPPLPLGAEEASICRPGFRNLHTYCVTKTGPTVDVASGTVNGVTWSIEAFHAVYTGPPPPRTADPGEAPTVSLPGLCMVTEGLSPQPESTLEIINQRGEGIGITLIGCPIRLLNIPPGSFPEVGQADPLPGLSWDGTSGYTVDGRTLVIGLTPPTTERIVVTFNGERIPDAELYGPFPELVTDRKFWVAVWPEEYSGLMSVRYEAYEGEGRLLWQETDRNR